MNRARRPVLAISAASLVSLCIALSGTALASVAGHGVKGDPQPEMTPFKIGAEVSPGGAAAIESNGSIVVAYDIAGGDGRTFVCVLARGGRKCSRTVTLTPPGAMDTEGTPHVFAPSPSHVVVLQGACCDTNSHGGDLLYTSTNGGATFGPPVRVGTLAVSVAALTGSDIVFSTGDDRFGAEVESLPVTASGPPASTAIATPGEVFDVGIAGYKGGVLIGSDSGNFTTRVAYAKSGANFNAKASYHNVGVFTNEEFLAISGAALLTRQTKGKESMEVRLFNGTRFGPAHTVPRTSGGGPFWATIDADPSGRVHVFSSTIHSARDFDLIEVSTSTGARWSGPVNLGNAISSSYFAAALDSRGTGIVLGGDPAIGYPVLATQGITLRLKASRIRKGRSTTASGRGFPAAKGRAVSLQVQRHGLWFTIATTHEGAGGSYRFTIKGSLLGAHRYRAVVSDLAGYLQFGYSNGHSLRVVS